MNPNYNQTITVYNCLRAVDNPNSKSDIWYKTVLKNCFYKCLIEQVAAGNGIRMANVYTVRIPESKDYKTYQEWIKLPSDTRSAYFTLGISDIIVKGDCMEKITGLSPDTASEFLKRKKPDAFVITAVSDNASHKHARHYRVGG